MSWGETKKLSDVIISNVVPSETIVKFVSASTSVQGIGIANISPCDHGDNGYCTLKIDDEPAVSATLHAGGTFSISFPFKKKIEVGMFRSATAMCVFQIYDRQSLGGGGRVVNLSPIRKAVAA